MESENLNPRLNPEQLLLNQKELQLSPEKLEYLSQQISEVVHSNDVAKAFQLLEQGANPNYQKDMFDNSPLHWAVRLNHYEIVELLLEFDAKVNACNGDLCTALHWASGGGLVTVAALLIKKGAKIDIRNKNYSTPLHWGVRFNHYHIVALLLKFKAKPNCCDSGYNTPLHWAARNGRTAIAILLLKNNAKIDPLNRKHCTPLLLAAQNGHAEMVRVLLIHGADPIDHPVVQQCINEITFFSKGYYLYCGGSFNCLPDEIKHLILANFTSPSSQVQIFQQLVEWREDWQQKQKPERAQQRKRLYKPKYNDGRRNSI